jgi:hypothetical protein
VVALLAVGFGVLVSRALSIPFWITNDVTSVLIDWQGAGLSCREPTVGMPGPMAGWGCSTEFEGVRLGASLEADAHGVFGIHVGVPAGTTGAKTARAFSYLIRATSLLSAAAAEMEEWLMSSDAADGVMPMTPTTGILRAAIYRDFDGDGHPVLSVVPLGSSMELTQPSPRLASPTPGAT